MSDVKTSSVPDDLVRETRDALTHFYDYAWLLRHPWLQRLRGRLGDEPASAVQQMRRMLLEVIERLRPSDDLPPNDPAWRPYTVLSQRYVLGRELSEVEEAMALGKRQIQREQRKGFEAVATVLWREILVPAGRQRAQEPDDALLQEIARTTGQRQAFDAGRQLERALASARAMAERYAITLRPQLPGQTLLVAGNALVYRQMLLSAFSFMATAAETEAIEVRLERKATQVVCSLIATAPGHLEHLARPEHLPETLLTLAESQKAKIALGTRRGQWSLEIALPAADEPVVLLVEDNQDLAALLSRYLTVYGYWPVAITTGADAVERISEARPDVVVLDVMMRDVDGWEVLQQLKSEPRLADIPVAICSVLNEPELAACLGADAYLHKPVRPAELLECVAGLLGRERSEATGSW